MIFSEISEGVIGAVFAGIVGLVGGGTAAWVMLKKALAEIQEKRDVAEATLAKERRNGVIEDLEKALTRCGGRNDAADTEIANLRGQVAKLYGEIAELRRLIAVKDVRVEGQATQVEKLQTAVTLMKDSAPTVNLPPGPVPVTIVPSVDPLPVAVVETEKH